MSGAEKFILARSSIIRKNEVSNPRSLPTLTPLESAKATSRKSLAQAAYVRQSGSPTVLQEVQSRPAQNIAAPRVPSPRPYKPPVVETAPGPVEPPNIFDHTEDFSESEDVTVSIGALPSSTALPVSASNQTRFEQNSHQAPRQARSLQEEHGMGRFDDGEGYDEDWDVEQAIDRADDEANWQRMAQIANIHEQIQAQSSAYEPKPSLGAKHPASITIATGRPKLRQPQSSSPRMLTPTLPVQSHHPHSNNAGRFKYYGSNAYITEEEEINGNSVGIEPKNDHKGSPATSRQMHRASDDGMTNNIVDRGINEGHTPRGTKRFSGNELDYPEGELLSMSYSVLAGEDFNSSSTRPVSIIPEDLAGLGQEKLEARLEYFSTQEPDQQKLFFKEISSDEWEKSGDWFIDQFSDLMKQLRDARKEKRAIVARFEREIEERQNLVANTSHELDETQKRMRDHGRRLLSPTPKGK